jgi:hypothetical protein
MVQYKAFHPAVESKGSAIIATLEGLDPKIIRPVLVEFGLSDGIQTGVWYPQQIWLNVLKAIDERQLGGDLDLVAIGTRIPYTADWPPEVHTLEDALFSIDIAYHMNHRNGDVGHYHAEKSDENEITMTCDNPFPCYFDYGIIYGTAQKFLPSSKTFTVVHGENSCRRRGDEACLYYVNYAAR